MKNKHVLLQLGYTSRRRLEGIADFAKSHNWSIILEDRSSLPSGWTGDGVMVLLRARQPKTVSFARKLAARGIPIIDLSICHPEVKLPRVIGDHAAIGALAADHFAERRFRNVALFAKDDTNVNKLRFGGFCRRWGEHSAKAPLELIWRKEVSALPPHPNHSRYSPSTTQTRREYSMSRSRPGFPFRRRWRYWEWTMKR